MKLSRYRPSLELTRYLCVIPVAAFMLCVMLQIDLPGLYMDAVNPDFLAAQILHHHLYNPSGALPSKVFPILGNLYHGVQNFYVDLPILMIFGFNVGPLRDAQALFGAVLLTAFYFIVRRLTRSNLLAMVSSLGLATEIAFTASFRTQFYIVMGGAAWLFVSLLLALPSDTDPVSSKRRTFWSGVFSGLAGYGYFVMFFFAPGMLALIALRPRSSLRETWHWIVGFVVGLTPFAVGYLSLILKLHGIAPTMALVRSLLTQLHPFAGGGDDEGSLPYVFRMAHLAVTNGGNDAVIFGHDLPSGWGEAKFIFLVIGTLLFSLCALGCLVFRRQRPLWALVGLLPLSYVLAAALFGHRLWAHHFCVLVPFVYLFLALVLANLFEMTSTTGRLRITAVGIVLFGCVTANAMQQKTFHQALAYSGGEGLSTQALTTLAVDARDAAPNVAYVFPEWGFFTSFCLLTENKVRYVIDIEPETLASLRRSGYEDFRLVYWQPSMRSHYVEVLHQAGAQAITERTFTTRDGRPVFYWLEGRPLPSVGEKSAVK